VDQEVQSKEGFRSLFEPIRQDQSIQNNQEVSMFSEHALRELLEYQGNAPVLSIYLNTDPVEGSADTYKLRLRSMLKEVDLSTDVFAVERYFDHEHNWSGRGVAVFSSAGDGFFRSYSFAVPVRDRVRVSDRPHVKPLADLLDVYGGYGVALVDKQRARLFYYHLGELRQQAEWVGENVRRIKRGGGSQAAGRRGGIAGQTNYVAELADRNMKEAADFAARFFQESGIRRVLIGGTEDNIAPFRNQLPKAWQSLVVGAFPIGMNASQGEVLARAIEIGQESERHREALLVESLVTSAAKGRAGVIGLDNTLSAVHEGRVQTLVILEGLRAPGYRCQGCRYLTAQEIDTCPFCGNFFKQIPDAVEMVVHRVMKDGGEVEVLHRNRAHPDFGGIGALLRY
jgi:peptide chain release factor subunit 1